MTVVNQIELRRYGIDIQSYLLLKAGLKPVIRVGTEIDMVKNLKKFAKNNGLYVLIKSFKKFYGRVLSKPKINVYFSLSKEPTEKAYNAEKSGNRKELGLLLGYPECCVDKFIENYTKNIDYMNEAYKNTKIKPSFYCNNIFVFDSKLGMDTRDTQTFYKNINLFLPLDYLSLIRHVPCSLDCKKSIKIGKITLKLLKDNSPSLAKEIVDTLRRSVLYWNYFEWIILKNRTEGDIIRYNGILNYESLVKKVTKNMVKEGNRIRIMDDRIVIFNNTEKIGEIPRKDDIPLCINFK